MHIVALLTGRGNNTLKDKNIRPVCGKPVIFYPASAAKGSKYIEDFFVSSNDDKILKEAEKVGYKAILRPQSISGPDSKHIEAINHSLEVMHQYGVEPDILVVLMANSVTIKSQWIDECIQSILDNGCVSTVVPVYKDMDHHPYRAKRINKNGLLDTYIDFGTEKVSTNRQELPANYFLCHNFWVLNVKNSVAVDDGQPPWTFMGRNVKPYVIDESIDIHDEIDIVASEKWIRSNWGDVEI